MICDWRPKHFKSGNAKPQHQKIPTTRRYHAEIIHVYDLIQLLWLQHLQYVLLFCASGRILDSSVCSFQLWFQTLKAQSMRFEEEAPVTQRCSTFRLGSKDCLKVGQKRCIILRPWLIIATKGKLGKSINACCLKPCNFFDGHKHLCCMLLKWYLRVQGHCWKDPM